LSSRPYTLALLIGNSVTDCSLQSHRHLGMDEVKFFTAPVFVGDTILRRERSAHSKRESKSVRAKAS